ncbi:MAG TPA: glutamate racemase [Candidatus Dormibacteraeota bacterium]|jgi:glutamate racemase|nr:glutamate racemase [Candidatus Dormibacteraeota bacterium]
MGDERPIGVFDSGVGGLTVLRAIRESLPLEPTIYVGDLARFPYGPRYQNEVKEFAFEIIRYLQSRDVKLVVIACNTATAAALHQARELFDLPIVGVIAPGAQAAVEATRKGLVGVISTEGTRLSQEYLHAIKELDPMIGVYQKACPELVEIVEAGGADTPRAEAALRRDLQEIAGLGADVLVLGCTHYPLLRGAIERAFPGTFRLVDSAGTTAAMVRRRLEHARMLADGGVADHELLVTAVPEGFDEVALRLFGGEVPTVRRLRLDPSPRRVSARV